METNYTGLGRMDLTTFTAPNVPAYATDINVPGSTSDVLSVVTDPSGALAFVTNAGHVYLEASELLPPLYTAQYPATTDAYITTGKMDYGLGDDKVALRLKLRHAPITTGQQLDAYLSVDGAAFDYVGTSALLSSTAPPQPLHVPEAAGRTFELKLQPTAGLVIERYDLQAYPSGAARGRTVIVPILLIERVGLPNRVEVQMDPLEEYEYLNSLVGAARPSTYQELSVGFSVFVEDVQFMRRDATKDRTWWNGTALLRLKVLGD
jgi:hypothetical protein